MALCHMHAWFWLVVYYIYSALIHREQYPQSGRHIIYWSDFINMYKSSAMHVEHLAMDNLYPNSLKSSSHIYIYMRYIYIYTCRDTFAPSYLHLSSVKAGAVAHEAAAQKCRLYSELCTTHKFIPLAFETSGVFSQDSLAFLKDLALRSRQLNHDPLSYLKLCQRISVCIQRFNCASVLGTCL